MNGIHEAEGSGSSMLRSKISELSDEDLSSFLRDVVLKGGYFHVGNEDRSACGDGDSSDMEAFQEFKRKSSLCAFSDRDEDCAIILLRSSSDVWSWRRLERQCKRVIVEHARMSLPLLADLLDVDTRHIQHISHRLCNGESRSSIRRVDDDFISLAYLDDISDKVMHEVQSTGRVLLSDMAREVFHLPLHAVLLAISRHISQRSCPQNLKFLSFNGTLITPSVGVDPAAIAGVREILTASYCEERFRHLHHQLSNVQVPTKLDDVTASFGWDISLTFEKVRQMCCSGGLDGEVRVSSSTASYGAKNLSALSSPIYVPRNFLKQQRQDMEDLYRSNGYVTALQCASLGIPSGRMEEYVKESFPEALCLSTALLDLKKFVAPLQVAILEAKSTQSFADLSQNLPKAIVSAEADVNALVDHVLQTMRSAESEFFDSIGWTITCDGEALFFSAEMVDQIRAKILEPLIAEFGKARAAEMHRMYEERSASPIRSKRQDCGPKRQASSTKNKKPTGEESNNVSVRSKWGKSQRNNFVADGSREDILPLRDVAKGIGLEYPELRDIQERCQSLAAAPDPQWDSLDASKDDGPQYVDGPLFEFCRRALYNDEFHRKCSIAVKAEHDRLRLTKRGASSSSSFRGATEARSIESAFEDVECFPTACHLLQVLAKSIKSLTSVDNENVCRGMLERQFLVGCAANFTRRITEYCLFKHDVEPGTFFFVPKGNAAWDESDTLPFYYPVPLGLRSFNPSFLSCPLGDNGHERDPLKVLEENLPTGVGAGLSALWSLCGKECYQGGQAEGNFDAFLEQARESCLTICGLPFKVLDKKAEKQLMIKRKQELLAGLETSLLATEVLDLTVILLFQQVKSVCVVGELIRGPILNLLLKEKKIPHHVSVALQEMAEAERTVKHPTSENLVALVRGFGLAKDISKTLSP